MKAVELRRGAGHQLHLFAGAGGSEQEVAAIAACLSGDPSVLAHVPAPGAAAVGSVEAMAAAAVAQVRAAQPHGPYRLLGYSMGGLLALEVRRSLVEDGEDVAFVGMVDTFFAETFWPTSIFVRASVRRATIHARALLRMPPAAGAREVGRRARSLSAKVSRRRSPSSPTPSQAHPAAVTPQEANIAVMNRWRPRTMEGPVTLFTATELDFGCDLAQLWRPWLPGLEVHRIGGNHHTILGTESGVAHLAAAVDDAMRQPAAPRVLVATTFTWPGAARLAAHLGEVGCTVEAVAPAGSPVHALDSLDRSRRLSLVRPLRSLTRVLTSSRVDLVVPFDDRTRQALERVHAAADPRTPEGRRIRALLERSLGAPRSFGLLHSRQALMDIATDAGILCPPTTVVRTEADVAAWLGEHPGPGVLKTDGSWGGRGVAVVATTAEGRQAWRVLSRPPSLHRALKRLLLERDPWALRALVSGQRPAVTIQPFVEGCPANAAFACAEGATLAQVHAEVVQSAGPTGPSTLVRLVTNPDIALAVKSVASALELSGVCGLDFIIDRDGRAHLLELNPRATPTAHLVGTDGSDPLSSLRAAWGHDHPPPREPSAPGAVIDLRPRARDDAAGPATGWTNGRTHFWLPWRRLPIMASTCGEGGDLTQTASARGTS